MQRRTLITALAMAGVASMAMVATPAPALAAAPKLSGIDLTGSSLGPDLHLSYTNGKPASIRDFHGKLVLLFFGFTQCPDVCPTALARAVEIKRLLGADGQRVQVLFATVDPERDTAPLLDAYMRAFDPGFIAVRGDKAQTARTAADFKIYYSKVPSGSSYTMDHTAITYVFDDKGAIRLALRHEQTAEQCAADLRTLLQAPSKSNSNFLKGLFQ